MKDNPGRDGIIISDKPLWEITYREHFSILGKRALSLPSKLLGFKPACLALATHLLKEKLISEWMWLIVLVLVLFGVVGLKVAGKVLSQNPKTNL